MALFGLFYAVQAAPSKSASPSRMKAENGDTLVKRYILSTELSLKIQRDLRFNLAGEIVQRCFAGVVFRHAGCELAA